jgi:hypothetical protein
VDRKYISFEPLRVAMTAFHVIIADKRVIYIWQVQKQGRGE